MSKTFVQGQTYILTSGTIFERGEHGTLVKHEAPYHFVPSEAEFNANKDRLVLVADKERETLGDVKVVERPSGIHKMKLAAAKRKVQVAGSFAELDQLETQELKRQKPRIGVLNEIKARRDQIEVALANQPPQTQHAGVGE